MLIVGEELAYVLVIEQTIVGRKFELTLHGVNFQERVRSEFEEVVKLIHWTTQSKANLVSLLNSLFTKEISETDKVTVVASYYVRDSSKKNVRDSPKKRRCDDDDDIWDEDEDD